MAQGGGLDGARAGEAIAAVKAVLAGEGAGDAAGAGAVYHASHQPETEFWLVPGRQGRQKRPSPARSWRRSTRIAGLYAEVQHCSGMGSRDVNNCSRGHGCGGGRLRRGQCGLHWRALYQADRAFAPRAARRASSTPVGMFRAGVTTFGVKRRLVWTMVMCWTDLAPMAGGGREAGLTG